MNPRTPLKRMNCGKSRVTVTRSEAKVELRKYSNKEGGKVSHNPKGKRNAEISSPKIPLGRWGFLEGINLPLIDQGGGNQRG